MHSTVNIKRFLGLFHLFPDTGHAKENGGLGLLQCGYQRALARQSINILTLFYNRELKFKISSRK